MKPDQTLEGLTASAIAGLSPVIKETAPDMVIVQGDTTTAFIGALAAFYNKIPVAHVEAGLRTNDPYVPFPEEMNRRLVSQIAALNFAPTKSAQEDLHAEGLKKSSIYKTGNTVIDALNIGQQIIKTNKSIRKELEEWFSQRIDPAKDITSDRKKMVLITGHRRESFGKGFLEICAAIKELAELFPSHLFLYPVHLNPRVREPVFSILSKKKNVVLINPVDYPAMLYLMSKSHLILTDSGGIQEEAPSLQVPVLVMRDKTERPEGVAMGCCKLVGNKKNKIVSSVKKVLQSPAVYQSMQCRKNPYGDGKASERIISIIKKRLSVNS